MNAVKPISSFWQHMQPVIYDYGSFAVLYPANTGVCVGIFYLFICAPVSKAMSCFARYMQDMWHPNTTLFPMNSWRNFLTMTNDWPCCGFSGMTYLTGTVLTNIYCLTPTTKPMPHHQYCVIKFRQASKISACPIQCLFKLQNFWTRRSFCVFWTTFAKFRKATSTFRMALRQPIRPSVRMELFISHWTDFHQIWDMNFFFNFVAKIKLTSDKKSGYFTWI